MWEIDIYFIYPLHECDSADGSLVSVHPDTGGEDSQKNIVASALQISRSEWTMKS